ncbi:hypothetical protein LNKW23_43730 [Paralimibaculum aggregatum]|uniref:Uncharacterized protein n=1 Tax=Paralimibaculum aggregatum TaxID=3036245 RepID=A0ABQ6LSV0_9RHOB|nr:hypothetical protein LNKW23_43730 [Limibaculum sp. NKW23]
MASDMAHGHGHCPRGARLRAGFLRGHLETATPVACMRRGGSAAANCAPMVPDAPFGSDRFAAGLHHVPAPGCRPGGIAIMDVLSSRGRVAARDLTETVGRRDIRLGLDRPGLVPRRSPSAG